MDRREFLRRVRYPAAALAAVPMVAVAADKGREAGSAAIEAMKEQFAGVQDKCATLKERLDRIEKRQKRMLRVVFAVAAITLGVDVSLLI